MPPKRKAVVEKVVEEEIKVEKTSKKIKSGDSKKVIIEHCKSW